MIHAKIDSRTKYHIKKRIEDFLYTPAYQRLHDRIKEVIRINGNLLRHEHPSFSYKGEFYNGTNYLPRFKNQYLDDSLKETMDTILEDRNEMEMTERPFVSSYLNRAMNSSNSMNDYVLLLPEVCIQNLNIPAGDPVYTFPSELSPEQVQQFLSDNDAWLLMLKKRLLLNLIL